MTFQLSYFFNYCLYSLIYQLSIYACFILQVQPLLFFLISSIIFIPSDIIIFYYDVSRYYMYITLDYLWRTIFRLDTNITYIVQFDEHNIIFDFTHHSSDSASEDIDHIYCTESETELTQSDDEMENIEITSTDFENVDEDINYDLD